MTTPRRPPGIVLVETPFLSQTGTEEVRAYVQSKYNLGLVALGSYIRAHSDLDVSLIHMAQQGFTDDGLVRRLRRSPPAVVGISLTSYSLARTCRIMQRIKEALPGTHICAGGPHVGIFPGETARLGPVDSIVPGDGEAPFLALCRRVHEGGGLGPEALPEGVYTAESLASGAEVRPARVPDLDRLPDPDLTLLGDHTRYRDFLSNRLMALLTSSRGCPFVCHYCLSQGSRYRPLSIERVMETLHRYRRMGVEYVEFWDETFNASLQRLDAFADAMLAAGLGLAWGIRGAVVNHVSRDVLVKLKASGLRLIQFGVETGSPRLLDYCNKRIDRQRILNAFALCRDVGLRTVANLMIHIPGETRREILEDFALLRRIRPTYVSVSIYNWAPGTTHYRRALETGAIPEDTWRAYARNPVGPEPVVHPVNEIPVEEVYRMRSRFLFRHYFNLPYVLGYLQRMERSEFRRALAIVRLMLLSAVRSRLATSRNAA